MLSDGLSGAGERRACGKGEDARRFSESVRVGMEEGGGGVDISR